jgi:hypothetical protein
MHGAASGELNSLCPLISFFFVYFVPLRVMVRRTLPSCVVSKNDRLPGASSEDTLDHRPVRESHYMNAARDRKIAAGKKCGGRKSYTEARPEMVELASVAPTRPRSPGGLVTESCGRSCQARLCNQPESHSKRRLWHRCWANRKPVGSRCVPLATK